MTRIAVLGWGSLIWDPRKLRISGDWFDDGPFLPVEFARVSQDGRLTLVLFPDAERVQVPWINAGTDNLEVAIENLRQREGTTTERIGFVDLVGDRRKCAVIPNLAGDIEEWARDKDIGAVVWTDLHPYFEEPPGTEFTEENVVRYLENLSDDAGRSAEEYVRKAPPQIKTRIRLVIEKRLGWTHTGE